MNTTSNLIGKLRDRDYRRGYVRSDITVGIPFQIRAIRKQHGWSQKRLAEEAEMLQPRISAIEKPGTGSLNIDTLERIAAAFDVALEVRFVPFSDLIKWSESFDPEGFNVKPFEEELGDAAKSLEEGDRRIEKLLQGVTSVGQYREQHAQGLMTRHLALPGAPTQQKRGLFLVPSGGPMKRDRSEVSSLTFPSQSETRLHPEGAGEAIRYYGTR